MLDTNLLVASPNGAVSTMCNATGLVFTGSSGYQILFTNTLDLPDNSIIQFNIVTSCADESASPWYWIYLETSTDLGVSWGPVQTMCDIMNSCSSFGYPGGSTLSSLDLQSGWETITYQLGVVPRGSRFRLRASLSGQSQKWAINNLYMGATCPNACSGQ